MPSSIESVWQCLKDAARSYANVQSLPTEQEAVHFVYTCFEQYRVDPFPPREVALFFAREYLQMIRSLQTESRSEAS
jgi:hypothetical protein